MTNFSLSRCIAAVATLIAAFFFAPSAALAAESLPIHDDHVPSTAEGFPTQQCNDFKQPLPDGNDGWHFVLPGNKAEFQKLTLTFEDSSGAQHSVTVEGEEDADGYFDKGKHAYVYTVAGWTLIEGTAEVTGGVKQGFFNLSHTCPGEPVGQSPSPSVQPTESPSMSPTETVTPSGSKSPDVSISPIPSSSPAAPGDGGDKGDNLPVTGSSIGILIGLGVALFAAGAGLLLYTRRRKAHTA